MVEKRILEKECNAYSSEWLSSDKPKWSDHGDDVDMDIHASYKIVLYTIYISFTVLMFPLYDNQYKLYANLKYLQR